MITGTVVDSNAPEREDARDIHELLDDEPSFPKALLDLTKWMSEYYLCGWGEVLDAALPTGLTPSSVFYARVVGTTSDEELAEMDRRAPKRTELLAYLRDNPGAQRVDHLQKTFGNKSIGQQLDALQRLGLVEVTTEVERERGPRTIRAVKFADDLAADESHIREVFDELDKRAPKQSLVLGHLYVSKQHGEPPTPVTQLAKAL